jgi:hypothetical protein
MSIIQGTSVVSEAGYLIERSLRFNSADTAYLNRTPGSASNRKTFTWSGWVKRGGLGTAQTIFSAQSTTTANLFYFYFGSNDTLNFYHYSSSGGTTDSFLGTTQVFRDASAWYHIVFNVDTTQATSTNRVKIYVNGSQVTAFGTAIYFNQNYDTYVNSTNAHRIGANPDNTQYLSAYLTEVNFIDGSALTPSSFGETNPVTGVWQPKKYTGTYGTNGFYLNFKDNSSTSALGTDYSGNGNTWTTNNFSVTAGAGNDSLVDTPTLYGVDTGAGGTVGGNYATLNPLSKTSPATISNGNLNVSTTASSANISIVAGTIGVSSGKWYWEVVGTAVDSTRMAMYVCDATKYGLNLTASTGAYGYGANGQKIQGDGTNWFGTGSAYGNSWTTNDVIGIALDMDNGKVWFSKNGTWQASGDPAAGTNEAFSGLSGSKTCGMYLYTEGSATTAVFNLGQRPFSYTAPSGFKALCTTNLPTPTIAQGNEYFNVATFSGNGSQASVTGVGFQPDFIWAKNRTNAFNHELWDAVRGVNSTLFSNATSAEDTTANRLVSFNADGFTYGTSSNLYVSATNSVAWNWKANGAGVTNTSGTITSTVSANTTAGFSIVTYTGNGVNGATVGHGLGVAPKMILVKRRTTAGASWLVYHANMAATPQNNFLILNATDAVSASALPWNNTAPTSTLITLGTSGGTNNNTDTFVAYCFSEVAGYSAMGSYTGNGSADGPFCYTGFRPRWILFKRTDNTSNWLLYDTARLGYNQANNYLLPDLTNAEGSGDNFIDILSNGFKCRVSSQSINVNSATYIYAAFCEVPYKFSLAR